MYGCELWNSLLKGETLELERLHRFSAKRIQHFHKRTRSIIAIGMLGWYSLEA
jgi:hypothetical protein